MKILLPIFLLFACAALALPGPVPRPKGIKWALNPPAEEVKAYMVYERTGPPDAYQYVAVVGVPPVAQWLFVAPPVATKTYVVTAINAGGESPFSDPVTITVTPVPTKPINVLPIN